MNKDRRPTDPAASRKARLGAALRANLARRKAQARNRAADDEDGIADPGRGGDNTQAGQNPHEGREQD